MLRSGLAWKWIISRDRVAIAENFDKNKAYVLPKANITLAHSDFTPPPQMQENVIILQVRKNYWDNAYVYPYKGVSDEVFLVLDSLGLQKDISNKDLRF